MEQKTCLYKKAGLGELQKQINKESKGGWFVHDVICYQRPAGSSELGYEIPEYSAYLVVYRKD